VTSSEIGRATVAGDNYACDIYRAKLQVTLDGHQSTLSLIVKSQPEKGEMAKVNILFCFMLHIRDNTSIVNRNTYSIFFLHIYHLHIRIYVLQISRSLWDYFLYATEISVTWDIEEKIGKITISVLYGVNVKQKLSTALNKKFNLTCIYLNTQAVPHFKQTSLAS